MAPRAPARLRLVAQAKDTLARFIVVRGGVPEGEARAAVLRGGAFLRGRRIRDLEAEVRAGDRVDVVLRGPEPPPLPRSRLLHLDAALLAVDKPEGVCAQEDLAGGPALPDLCSELLAQLGEKETQALLVHRLDRGTTGVTVLARTRKAQAALLAEFREHRVRKEYRALVQGTPERDEGVADARLGPAERGLRKVDPRGETALTRYRVLERFAGAALISAVPETGRTHQIRVHLRELGCPLWGDTRYGGHAFVTRPDGTRLDFSRPMLHAQSLSLRHPGGSTLEVTALTPPDFEMACAFLRRSR